MARVGTSGWDRVLPLIKLGRLPAVLPDEGRQVQAIQVLDAHSGGRGDRQLVASRRSPPPFTDGGVRTQRTLCLRPA